VDISCYLNNDDSYFVKELTILCVNTLQVNTWFFESPYDYMCQTRKQFSRNSWVYRNLHGIFWEYGHLPQDKLGDVLKTTISPDRHFEDVKIYSKGREKCKFLTEVLGHEVENLFQCSKMTELPVIEQTCEFHKYHKDSVKKHCTLYKSFYYLKNAGFILDV